MEKAIIVLKEEIKQRERRLKVLKGKWWGTFEKMRGELRAEILDIESELGGLELAINILRGK